MGYDYGTATTAEESLLAGFFAGMRLRWLV